MLNGSQASGPFNNALYQSTSREEKVEKIALHFQAIMELLGLDLSDPSLIKTPERVATMYVDEIFSGLNPEMFPSISLFPNTQPSSQQDNNLIVTKASFVSFCEHHFIPMIGTAYIGYIPGSHIIGLSKISRLVRYFAARPQLQERLTHQIAASLQLSLQHNNIGVMVKAQHLCVIARGVQDEEAATSTTEFKGLFSTSSHLREQFFELIKT